MHPDLYAERKCWAVKTQIAVPKRAQYNLESCTALVELPVDTLEIAKVLGKSGSLSQLA